MHTMISPASGSSRCRYITFNEPLPIGIIAAFVRLGKKYQIDAVLSEALRRLYHEFPVELAELDQSRAKTTAITRSDSTYIDVVNLAREQNLLSVLPYALHCCSKKFSDDLVKGAKREDHTIAVLSSIDERAVLVATHPLLRLRATTTFSWLDAPGHEGCKINEACEHGRNRLMKKSLFPVHVYGGLICWKDDWEWDICAHCVMRAKRLHGVGRYEYWSQLPSIFGLPNWEELKKERILSTTYALLCFPSLFCSHSGLSR